jgi:ribose transport system ATP-binding protein
MGALQVEAGRRQLTLEPLLKLHDIRKSFYGVPVLKGVNFEVLEGEVHALLGENGAGKSTLIKIISGAHKVDSGTMSISGREIVPPYDPKMAENLGIATIYQTFHLVPHLSVAENLALSEFTSHWNGLVNWSKVYSHARTVLERINFKIDPSLKVKDLSVANKQMVEIAAAVSKNARLMIMDEPTAALSRKETEILFEMIQELRKKRIGIIYVSHKLEEIKRIAERATILRDGNIVATVDVSRTEMREIIELMIGKALVTNQHGRSSGDRQSVFSAEGITNSRFTNPISFSLRENEILGITGLVGAGKTELASAIFGIDKITGGQIRLNGRRVNVSSPRKAVKLGIGLLPEDRDSKGLCLNMGITENITMVLIATLKSLFLNLGAEKSLVKKVLAALKIRATGISQQVRYLSGGNKQKVVLGKWLEANCHVLILDEPTIGIDVGAREEIYELLGRFVAKGKNAVIVASSDTSEILDIADRILVLSGYSIVAELDPKRTSKQEILEYASLYVSSAIG